MTRTEIIGDAVLYLGDALEIMPTLGKVDAVVTDPPYGIGINRSNRLSVSRGFGGQTWDEKRPSGATWAMMNTDRRIIWGGNYFADQLPPTRGWLVWDKNNAGRDFADFELAWTDIDMVGRRIILRPMNMDGGKVHPTQKPIAVMKWCLSFIPEANAILDPFMGSGSTGVACAKLGRKFIGIEIDEGYFDIACRRIEDAYRQPDMFIAPPAPKPVQKDMGDI